MGSSFHLSQWLLDTCKLAIKFWSVPFADTTLEMVLGGGRKTEAVAVTLTTSPLLHWQTRPLPGCSYSQWLFCSGRPAVSHTGTEGMCASCSCRRQQRHTLSAAWKWRRRRGREERERRVGWGRGKRRGRGEGGEGEGIPGLPQTMCGRVGTSHRPPNN